MDEELTAEYSEPCGQCAAVNWGVSDGGHFFCKNCHNVIEKTKAVFDVSSLHSKNSRITTFKKSKRKREEDDREWMVCEGFQFILKHQAKALVSLGVCMKFETEVVWNFWKRYLQSTQQAFTETPVYTPRFTVYSKRKKSEPEPNIQSDPSSHGDSEATSDNSGFLSCSGYTSEGQSSLESVLYRHSYPLMTMPRTLALCYLALLWVREAITLTDLLRLVSERRVPYIDIQDVFPQEMRLFGRDVEFFRVRKLPLYSVIHREALLLAKIMKLPSFPTISQDCLLHPLPLTVRYLLEANLPDALHVWVHKVIKGAGMDDDSYLTFDPSRESPHLLHYEIQAVAVIIVTLKLLFKLDDHVEWKLSEEAARQKKKEVFRLNRWFEIVQPVLEKARKNEEREEALRKWKPTNPFITSLGRKNLIMKKRRLADYLEHRFRRLSDPAPEQLPSTTKPHSSFRFSWGNEQGSDGPSMYNSHLDGILNRDGVSYLTNRKYWHPELRLCVSKSCGDHFPEVEPWLPRMYSWVLDLFSFILGIRQAEVHKAVLDIERRFLKRNHSAFKWTYNSLSKKIKSKTRN